MLTRIWQVPDDLPHAAGLGNLARVKLWFDSAGVVRTPDDHYPYNDPDARSHLKWDTPTAQQVLDVALAFAVINRHFDVADFLLEHGADVNTNWNSHEPASILHHLVFLPNPYESMRFLIDRGIDMTIKDYRGTVTQRVGRDTARATRRWRSGWRKRNGSGSGEHDEHASPHSPEVRRMPRGRHYPNSFLAYAREKAYPLAASLS